MTAKENLEDLMLLAQSGDSKAYSKLLHQCESLLEKLLRPRLLNYADLSDVVQDVLISLHKSRHTYQEGRPFKPWLFAIANYRLKDHFRKYYKQLNLEKVFLDELVRQEKEPNVTNTSENYEELLEAIERLPEKQNKLVTLAKIEGYTSREIAKQMEMSESAVKVSIHRSLKKIQDLFQKDGNK